MLKKILPFTALLLFTMACSLTDKLTSTPEPVVIVVTATPEQAAQTADPVSVVTETVTDTISEPVSASLTLLAGPIEETLVRNDSNLVAQYCADLNVKNFASRVTFTNLPAFDTGENSFALFFRSTGSDDQYRLIIYNTGWEFYNVRNTDHVLVNKGQLAMTWDIHGDNTLEVYAVEDTGYFYLNGYRIFTLNLKDRDYPGDVCVVTSVYTSDTYGVVSEFKDFEVWEMIPQ
jgi:hypothetical protein